MTVSEFCAALGCGAIVLGCAVLDVLFCMLNLVFIIGSTDISLRVNALAANTASQDNTVMYTLQALTSPGTNSKYGPETLSLIVGGESKQQYKWLGSRSSKHNDSEDIRNVRGSSAPPSLFVLPARSPEILEDSSSLSVSDAADQEKKPSSSDKAGPEKKPLFLFAPSVAPGRAARGMSLPPGASSLC